MCSSNRPPLDPQEVEEFQFPGLAEPGEDGGAVPWEFTAWDFGEPEGAGGSQRQPTPGVEEILAKAQSQAQDIERRAYEEGFRQGLKDGQEVGRRGLEEVVQRLLHLVEELDLEKERLLERREEWLVKLVLVVSRKLVARELSLHQEVIREIIAQAFHQLSHQEGLKVVVSPQDYEILSQENLDSWPSGVELVADGSLTPGGVRLETALGEVDGSVETRWQLVEEVIHQALEKSHAP
jgi:flagellar assembly protein FliH